ncbi:hypothetical protein ACEQUB_00118 [Ralstonia syzygii]|uniref:Uncharacterized protein n=1 Tax=Ralstonia syzygii R24 TaxID=907261 RepID=G3A3Q5_9RALS|nr:hypothetical protein RALSY_30260 [Ralstonia syzygii R24]
MDSIIEPICDYILYYIGLFVFKTLKIMRIVKNEWETWGYVTAGLIFSILATITALVTYAYIHE